MNLKGGLVGGRGCVAGNCHIVVLKPQIWGSKVEKPTRKLHVRVFPLHLEGRFRVDLNHKVQELNSIGSCVKYWVQVFATRIWQTMFLRDSGRWKHQKKTGAKGQMSHLSPTEEQMDTRDSDSTSCHLSFIPLPEKTRMRRLVFLLLCQDLRD